MGRGTKSKTLADLLPLAARDLRRRARGPLQGRRAAGSTAASTEVREIVRPLALGLVDLGVEKGDRVSILGNTRARVDLLRLRRALDRRHRGPDLPDQLARGVPATCSRTPTPRSSSSRTTNSWRRSAQVRDQLPQLEHVVRMTGSSEDAISMEDLAAKGAGGDAAELGGALTRRSPRTTSAPSSTPPAPPGRRRAASSATATTGRCSTWSTRPASSRTKTSPTSTCPSPTPSPC